MNISATQGVQSSTRWPYYRDLASILCSRESTYRAGLDLTGFEIPTVLGDVLSFRGVKKTIESFLEGSAGAGSIALAPHVTTFMAKILGKFLLPEELQKNTLNLIKLSMGDTDDLESLKKGVELVKDKESQDKKFIASLYEKSGKIEIANRYKNEADELVKFCDELEINEKTRESIKKIKKASIIAQSTIEGAWWGGWGLMLRGIRKYILKADSYTGTETYATESGDGEMKLWQKIIGVACIFIAPVTNTVLLNITDNKEKVKNSKFLKTIKENFDMTHGVYPKLGLLFSITSYPKWIGVLCSSQGLSEFLERLLTVTTIIPSWWMGHRVTNGVFAKGADERIAKKYDIEGGILVENEFLKSENSATRNLPEPAKIHHVLETAKERGAHLDEETRKKLMNDVEDEHAMSLGKGFAAHSAGIWVIKMGINQIVKQFTLWRQAA
jgi:hypothetical protein